jgi:predicted DCC family thiol-disulfide oxidoreductase YuxK
MRRLTVLFDVTCPLCVQCANWLGLQPAYVELELLAANSELAVRRYGDVPWRGADLVVVSDEGDVWAGAAAFLVCLWALRRWREWSYRLSGPAFLPLAQRFFHMISTKRRSIGNMMVGRTRCTDASCRHPGHAQPYR